MLKCSKRLQQKLRLAGDFDHPGGIMHLQQVDAEKLPAQLESADLQRIITPLRVSPNAMRAFLGIKLKKQRRTLKK